MRFALLLIVLLGCSHDVHVRYPAAPDAPTGTLVLLLSQPASGVSVAINGKLVVEDAKTRKVVIATVPAGTSEVLLAANGADKQMRVWVDDAQTTTVPLGVPDGSTALWKSILGTVISLVAYSMLR
jgi:hypothetical protein